MKTFADRFNELFDILGNAEQEAIFNEWASETGNEQIYQIEDFDDIMSGFEPLRVACMVRYGDFNPHYPAFTFNGCGNLESIENTAEYIDDYVYDMCNYFEDHQERLAELAGDDWDEINRDEEEEDGRASAESVQNGDLFLSTRLSNNWVVVDHDNEFITLVRAEKYYYPEEQTTTDFWKVTPRFFEDNFIAL